MKHLEHFRSLKRFVCLTDIPTGAAEYNTSAFLSNSLYAQFWAVKNVHTKMCLPQSKIGLSEYREIHPKLDLLNVEIFNVRKMDSTNLCCPNVGKCWNILKVGFCRCWKLVFLGFLEVNNSSGYNFRCCIYLWGTSNVPQLLYLPIIAAVWIKVIPFIVDFSPKIPP